MQTHAINHVFVLFAAVGFAVAAPGAAAQSHSSGYSASQHNGGRGIPVRGFGVQGQRASLPGLNRSGGSLLNRQITLPGLSPTQPRAGGTADVAGHPGYIYGGRGADGIHIGGAYDDGDLSLRLHLGSGGSGAVLLPDGRVYYPAGGGGYAAGVYTQGTYLHTGLHTGRYGYGAYSNPYWYYDSGRYWSRRPVDGVLNRQLDPTLLMRPQPLPAQPVEPVRELTALERARAFLKADEAEKAVTAFRDHLDEDPEDVNAMRSLGLAMLDAGRLSDGTAMVALAYRTDAMLARKPADLDELGLGARRHDRLLSRVLAYAKRTDAGSAHLAGVVLLQAEGKVAGASRVLDRAERAGLDEDIVDALRRELGTPAHR